MSHPTLSVALMHQAVAAVEAAKGNQCHAASALGISRTTLQGRLRAAALHREKLGMDTDPESAAYLKSRIRRLEADLKGLRKFNEEQGSQLHIIKSLIRDCDEPITPPKWLDVKSSGANTGVPTLLASDWHFDEVVDPRQINGVNAFNRPIALKRIKRLFTKTVDLLVHHMAKPKYDYFVLDLGGDMLSGNIHEELRETNETPVSLSMLALMDALVAGIDLLLTHFPRMVVNCVPGNHGRWDKKSRAKNRVYETYEWILYQFLAKHYGGNKDVHFNVADGADLPYTIYRTRYLLTHGDQFKGGSGIAGALSPLMLGDARKRKRAIAIDQPFDYMVLGHWHQYIMAKGIIVNGSLKGADEYSFQSNFDYEPPIQALWVTHPVWGITARWPVFLERPGARF